MLGKGFWSSELTQKHSWQGPGSPERQGPAGRREDWPGSVLAQRQEYDLEKG